jgi:signal transduction histidine kinase/ActR/RegA family two-component response regulator
MNWTTSVYAPRILKLVKIISIATLTIAYWTSSVTASPIKLTDASQEFELTSGVGYLNDRGDLHTANDLRHSDLFSTAPTKVNPLTLLGDKYAVTWIRFELENQSKNNSYFYITLAEALASRIEVYEITPQSVKGPLLAGRSLPVTETLPSRYPSFLIDFDDGQIRTILIKVISKQTSSVHPWIRTPAAFSNFNMTHNFIIGGYLGASLAICLGMLFFINVRRPKPLLSFSAYLLSLILFIIAKNASTHGYLNNQAAEFLRLHLVYLTTALIVSTNHFSMTFLDTKIRSPFGHKITILMIVVAMATLAAHIWDKNYYIWNWIYLEFLATRIISVILAFKIWKMGHKDAQEYLIGASLLLVCVFVTVGTEIGLLAPTTLPTSAIYIGNALQMAFLAYGAGRESRRLTAKNEKDRIDAISYSARLDTTHALMNEREKSDELNSAIISAAPVPLLLLDSDFRVLRVNACFAKTFRMDQNDIISKFVYSIGHGEWDLPDFRTFLNDTPRTENAPIGHTFEINFHDIGHRVLRVSAQKINQSNTIQELLLIAIEDITEEMGVKEKMKLAAESAMQSNQTKSDFLANMSHEIRTPLAVILGYSEILRKSAISDSQQSSHVARINASAEHLLSLVDEILDLSKIEAGKLELDYAKIHLLPELEDTMDLIKDGAKARGLTLEVLFEGPLPRVITTSPLRLKQILLNVIGNAVKFTEVGGVRIIISMPSPSMISFEVQDTGCGLTLLQQSRLFQPFTQADSSVTRKYGGTGLGLAISRQLAQAMGGTIELVRSQLNNGSCFKVTINPHSISDVRPVTEEEQRNTRFFAAKLREPNSTRLTGLRILLVEDSPDIQMLLSLFIRGAGALVDVANNGQEGVARAMSEEYDAVLMDIQMPVLDGMMAMRQLLERGYTRPVIALTAHAMNGEREQCMSNGFADYISKPVKSHDLLAMIAKHTVDKRGVTLDNPNVSSRAPMSDKPLIAPFFGRYSPEA